MVELGRLITAMITPFDEDGAVDFDEAGRLASALVDSGSDGLVITGTTGETPTLSFDEKLGMYEATKKAVGDRAAIIAGTTGYNTAEGIALSKEAEALGVDGILMTVPSYNKPPQEGLYQHFKTIAGSVSLPCVLYNVPSRTALNMTDETTVRLSHIDNIVGTKEASSDPVQITKIIRDTDDDFKVWSGNDDETFPIMCSGGYGIVSVASHLVGSQIKTMMGLILEGDIESAAAEHLRLFELFKILFVVTNPIPVKYCVGKVGFNVGQPRLPLIPPDEGTAATLDAAMSRYNIDLKLPVAVGGDD